MQCSFVENVRIFFRVSMFNVTVFPVSYILFTQKKMQFNLGFTQKKNVKDPRLACETRGILDFLGKETETNFCTGKVGAMWLWEGTFLIKKN